jgi:TolA-binding protein
MRAKPAPFWTPSILVALAFAPGCLVLKPDHDELAREVDKLRKEVLAQTQASGDSQKLAAELDAKVNQADLGLRVDNLETDVQELRGQAENADYVATAVKQELLEARADLDQRLASLEEKLNEATSIPEGKTELLSEADRQFAKKGYKQARKLWRTYESRYPGDERTPEVKFKIGLTYFSERDYKSALGEFYPVVQEHPNSESVPDALYYSGLAFAKLGQCKNAIAYFDALKQKKTKAPKEYKDKAAEQIKLQQADKGDICVDKDG